MLLEVIHSQGVMIFLWPPCPSKSERPLESITQRNDNDGLTDRSNLDDITTLY